MDTKSIAPAALPICTFSGIVADSPKYIRGDRSAHEHFHIRTDGGATLELVENLSLAPWIPVQTGDAVTARGEYIAEGRGGEPVLHWLHDDPQGRHAPGWVVFGGKLYD